MKIKRFRFIIGGSILLLVLIYLIYTGMEGTMRYYMTVSELMAKGNSVYGEKVNLGGRVVRGSIEWDKLKLKLKFRITDGKKSLPVIYKGVIPDAFKNGASVVAEGTYSPRGFFRAAALLAKCPSKYLSAIPEKKK